MKKLGTTVYLETRKIPNSAPETPYAVNSAKGNLGGSQSKIKQLSQIGRGCLAHLAMSLSLLLSLRGYPRLF